MSTALSGPSSAAAGAPWLDDRAYPFAHNFIKLGKGRMHYVDTAAPGDGGAPLLFVHGTPTWSFEYRHLIAGLCAKRRCVAPDHLGFGLSERPVDFDYTPEAHARNLREFVSALGLREFTLVVHDFGGPIGLPLAFDAGLRVDRVALLNTWMWGLDDDPTIAKGAKLMGGLLGRLLYRYFNLSLRVIMPSAYGDRSKLTPAVHRQYLACFADGGSRGRVLWPLARALLRSTPHYEGLWAERARLAEKSTLIVWGMKDAALGPHMLDRLRGALPRARVVRAEGSGHWPHEEEPGLVLEAFEAWLKA